MSNILKIGMRKVGLELWTKPDNYFGDYYPDYYVGPSISRDSGALEQTNFEAALELLGGEGSGEVRNPNYDPNEKGSDESGNLYQDETIPAVRVERFNHWAVGWVEQIFVHKDAEDKVAILQDIEDKLSDYPVLDDDAFSAKEYEEIEAGYDSWGRDHVIDLLSLEEFMDYEFDNLSSEVKNAIEKAISNCYFENAHHPEDFDDSGVLSTWEDEVDELASKNIHFIYATNGAIVGVWGESDLEQLKRDYGDELDAGPEKAPVSKDQMRLPFEGRKKRFRI